LITLKRAVQGASLAVFIALLWLTAFPLIEGASVRLALLFDPFLTFGVDLAARSLAVPATLSCLVLGSALFLGRAFCGHICPMGATFDLASPLFGRKTASLSAEGEIRLKGLKYLILAGMLCAAAFGVSLVFWGAPLALVTRFYALSLAAPLGHGVAWLLGLSRPVTEGLGIDALTYAKIGGQRFADPYSIALFFLALFLLSRAWPRFWCRYLCPAGAMLALFSFKPLVVRRVSDACVDCGACRRRCPMAAIPAEPRLTRTRECLLCKTCQRICPENAISFGVSPKGPALREDGGYWPSRRRFLAAGSAGAAAAALTLTGLREGAAQTGDPGAGVGKLAPASLIRPPGVPPEPLFLEKCVRCGACMRVCPSNMLQPDWLLSGLGGLFSPVAVPRRGGCQPLCNACGQVCPSGAIPSLPLEEKMWAKMGTAVINRQKCLAWEQDKKCLVCDEVCLYDALLFVREPGLSVAVPSVIENKCSGCGMCEQHCPVESAAIVVEAIGAVRLAEGSFAAYGRDAGLRIEAHRKPAHAVPPEEAAPGLPPGFSE